MGHKWVWGGLVCLLLGCTRAPEPGAESARHSDSGVIGAGYADMLEGLRNFERAHPDLVSSREYGKSVQDRPLFLMKIGRDVTEGPRPVALLTQAIHGDEYLAVVDKLPAEFLDHPDEYPAVTKFIARGGILYFVPIANPDGYEARRRENARSVDLNRNWDVARYAERVALAEKGELAYTDYELQTLKKYVAAEKFTEPETKQLADAIKRDVAEANGRLKLYFDYHCCQEETIGSLMHSWGDTKELHDGTIPLADIPRFEKIATLFASVFPGHLWGSGYQVVQYLTFGTTDEWFYETFAAHGALTFCYEGQARGEDAKLKAHARMWDRMLSDPTLTDVSL